MFCNLQIPDRTPRELVKRVRSCLNTSHGWNNRTLLKASPFSMLSTASECRHIFSKKKKKKKKSGSLCYLNAEHHCQALQYDRQHFHKTSALAFLPSDVLDPSSLFQITYLCLYTSIHYISPQYIPWMTVCNCGCYAKLYAMSNYKTNQTLSNCNICVRLISVKMFENQTFEETKQ